MKPYTVILLRPEDVTDPSLVADTILMHVNAETYREAIDDAQTRAHARDYGFEAATAGNPFDYTPLFVFEGHIVSIGGTN